jgi:hypothetical protein
MKRSFTIRANGGDINAIIKVEMKTRLQGWLTRDQVEESVESLADRIMIAVNGSRRLGTSLSRIKVTGA